MGWRLGGKTAPGHIGSAFLAWALETFAGSAAVDARSAGPYGVLSAVDNRQDKRGVYAGLDHAPSPTDLEAFLGRFKPALDARGLPLKGITTDGSQRSPDPLRTVFGAVPHPMWTFHVIKALTKGIVKAVAKARERLATVKPQVKRGRPASQEKAARRLARQSQGMGQNSRDGCQERCLFVKRYLQPSERQRLLSRTRGFPQWRTWREIMEHVDAVFDRRCRTPTALGTLQTLRQWVNRCPWIGDT